MWAAAAGKRGVLHVALSQERNAVLYLSVPCAQILIKHKSTDLEHVMTKQQPVKNTEQTAVSMKRHTEEGKGVPWAWERTVHKFVILAAGPSQDREEAGDYVMLMKEKKDKETKSNDTAARMVWHDLLKNQNNEIMKMWPEPLISSTSLCCPQLDINTQTNTHTKRCTLFSLVQIPENKPINKIRSAQHHLLFQPLCWCVGIVNRIQARLYPPAGPKVGQFPRSLSLPASQELRGVSCNAKTWLSKGTQEVPPPHWAFKLILSSYSPAAEKETWKAWSSMKSKAGFTDTAAPIALKALIPCNLP